MSVSDKLAEFKASILASGMEAAASTYLMERIPYVFADNWELYRTWKRKLAKLIEVDPLNITIIGSAGIGLASARHDESSPMVPVKVLNRFLGELGYHHLAISAGIAHFELKKEALKRPLLRYIRMETLPGINVDREDVYPLYRVMNIFDALVRHALERKPKSSIIERIEKVRNRMLRTLGLDYKQS